MRSWPMVPALLVALGWLPAQEAPPAAGTKAAAAVLEPQLVTSRTRADTAALGRLQRPGTILFRDAFETEASLQSYFEVGGQREGRARITFAADEVRRGKGALRLAAAANDGKASGASAMLWLGDDGHDCLHLRYWIRYAPDYDQGNLNHTGGSLAGVAGTDKWRFMGGAGHRPAGDDHFSTRVEGWRDWQRVPAPGWLFCYVYWMDMQRDRDGNFWGNMLGPDAKARIVPPRGEWLCVEQRVAVNTPGKADGELAVWLDGTLYLHYTGLRWRSSADVRLKRASLMVYVHESRRDNAVSYDDVVVSTGYVGTGDPVAGHAK